MTAGSVIRISLKAEEFIRKTTKENKAHTTMFIQLALALHEPFSRALQSIGPNQIILQALLYPLPEASKNITEFNSKASDTDRRLH